MFVEDIWYMYNSLLSEGLVVMITDEEGNDWSIADITISCDERTMLESLDDDSFIDYCYNIAYEVAHDLGYKLSGESAQ